MNPQPSDYRHPGQPIPFTRIAALIGAVKGIAATSVTPSSVLACELGFDSLDRQTLACELDEAFDIECRDDQVARWHTAIDVARTVAALRTRERA